MLLRFGFVYGESEVNLVLGCGLWRLN